MSESPTTKTKRTLVLGFDAATFDIMRPMMKEGKLPNFRKLMNEGSSGDLESVPPPVTPPAWTSFTTGKNPGKHGVFNFYYHSLDPSKDDEQYFVNSYSVKANTIWEILGQKGKKSIVINLPVTYPIPPGLDGILISGLLTPNNVDDFIYPRELHREILEKVGPYKTDSHPTTDWSRMTFKERLEYYFRIEEQRTKAALYLLKNHPWDFFTVMFSFTDKIPHLVYYHIDKDYPESKEMRQYLYRTYETADRIVGEFLAAIDGDTTVFVISDHGFGHQEKGFVSNRWLLDHGYMNLKKVNILNLFKLYQLKKKRIPVDKLLIKLHLEFLRKRLPLPVREKLLPLLRPQKRVSRSVVDWSRTKAYGSDYGIRINLLGREKCGTVEPGKPYEALREEITERLYELRDPDTGEKIMDRVYRREELYSGPYLEKAPDLMYLIKNCSYTQYDIYHFRTLFRRNLKFSAHRINGIFLSKGDGIKPDHQVSDARIIDVAPTLFHAMGLPVPDDMDGRVLTECFEEGALKDNPVRFEPALPPLRENRSDGDVYSEQHVREMMDALKGLGYLG